MIDNQFIDEHHKIEGSLFIFLRSYFSFLSYMKRELFKTNTLCDVCKSYEKMNLTHCQQLHNSDISQLELQLTVSTHQYLISDITKPCLDSDVIKHCLDGDVTKSCFVNDVIKPSPKSDANLQGANNQR